MRKIRRNILKNKLGTNKIARTWRNMQIKKFGVSEWCRIYNACNVNSKEYYVTPEDVLSGRV